MRELGAVARVEVGQQVEPPLVERAVAAEATQRYHAVGAVTADAGARHKVGRVDGAGAAADKAAASVDLPPLLL